MSSGSEHPEGVSGPTAPPEGFSESTLLDTKKRRDKVRMAMEDTQEMIVRAMADAAIDAGTLGASKDAITLTLQVVKRNIKTAFEKLFDAVPEIHISDDWEKEKLQVRLSQLREEVRVHRQRIARHKHQFLTLAERYRKQRAYIVCFRENYWRGLSELAAEMSNKGLNASVVNRFANDLVNPDDEQQEDEEAAGPDGIKRVKDWFLEFHDDLGGLKLLDEEEVAVQIAEAVNTVKKAEQLKQETLEAEMMQLKRDHESAMKDAVDSALAEYRNEKQLFGMIKQEYEQRIDELQTELDVATNIVRERVGHARKIREESVSGMSKELEAAQMDSVQLRKIATQLDTELVRAKENEEQLKLDMLNSTMSHKKEVFQLRKAAQLVRAKLDSMENPDVLTKRVTKPYIEQVAELQEVLYTTQKDRDDTQTKANELEQTVRHKEKEVGDHLIRIDELCSEQRLSQSKQRQLERENTTMAEELELATEEKDRLLNKADWQSEVIHRLQDGVKALQHQKQTTAPSAGKSGEVPGTGSSPTHGHRARSASTAGGKPTSRGRSDSTTSLSSSIVSTPPASPPKKAAVPRHRHQTTIHPSPRSAVEEQQRPAETSDTQRGSLLDEETGSVTMTTEAILDMLKVSIADAETQTSPLAMPLMPTSGVVAGQEEVEGQGDGRDRSASMPSGPSTPTEERSAAGSITSEPHCEDVVAAARPQTPLTGRVIPGMLPFEGGFYDGTIEDLVAEDLSPSMEGSSGSVTGKEEDEEDPFDVMARQRTTNEDQRRNGKERKTLPVPVALSSPPQRRISPRKGEPNREEVSCQTAPKRTRTVGVHVALSPRRATANSSVSHTPHERDTGSGGSGKKEREALSVPQVPFTAEGLTVPAAGQEEQTPLEDEFEECVFEEGSTVAMDDEEESIGETGTGTAGTSTELVMVRPPSEEMKGIVSCVHQHPLPEMVSESVQWSTPTPTAGMSRPLSKDAARDVRNSAFPPRAYQNRARSAARPLALIVPLSARTGTSLKPQAPTHGRPATAKTSQLRHPGRGETQVGADKDRAPTFLPLNRATQTESEYCGHPTSAEGGAASFHNRTYCAHCNRLLLAAAQQESVTCLGGEAYATVGRTAIPSVKGEAVTMAPSSKESSHATKTRLQQDRTGSATQQRRTRFTAPTACAPTIPQQKKVSLRQLSLLPARYFQQQEQ